MATYAIGDVHGCSLELQRLIGKINPHRNDRFVFVGDLVHKGPDSAGVVRFVRDLLLAFDGFCVSGNHEATELRKPTDGLDEDAMAWLATLPLFQRIQVDGKKFFVVHAGLNPSFYEKHPEGVPSDIPGDWRKGGGKKMERMRRFTRIRWVDAAGEMVELGKEKPENGDRFWADWYDGREGHVLFGHEPFLGNPGVFKHATGLDTGCVFGDRLTAMRLEDGEFIQVEADRKYAERRRDVE